MPAKFVTFTKDKQLQRIVNQSLSKNFDIKTPQSVTEIDHSQYAILDFESIDLSLIRNFLSEVNDKVNQKTFLLAIVDNDSVLQELVQLDYFYDVLLRSEKKSLTYHKRLQNYIQFALRDSSMESIKNQLEEIPQSYFQLNEIFLFEENLQLNFFDMDLSNSLRLLLNKLENSLQAEICLFFHFDFDNQSLNLKSASSKNYQDKEIQFVIDQSDIIDKVIGFQRAMILSEIDMNDHFLQFLFNQFKLTLKSLIITPVFQSDRIYGITIAVNKRYRTAFSNIDLAFGQVVANKFTMIIDNKISWNKLAKEGQSVMMQLAKERDDLREMLNKLEFAILIFSKKGNIYFMNENVMKVLKLKAARNIYKNLNQIFDENVLEIIKSSNSIVGAAATNEFLFTVEEDQFIRVGFSLSHYFIQDANDNGFIMTFKDITHSQYDKESLIRFEKLASLGVLASGIAHEIRNPLAGIKTMAQTLLDELKNEDQREYVSRIVRQVNRLNALLKSMFSFSKPSRPEKKPVQFKDLFAEVIPLVQNKLAEKKLQIEQNYEKELEMIAVDTGQLEQVLMNILMNAIDASKENNKIEISVTHARNLSNIVNTAKAKFSLTNARYLEITVKDFGKGMEEETLNKVFDPFFTTKAEGTGLGLSIVHQIITEHDGYITMNSKINEGTSVKIFLPYN